MLNNSFACIHSPLIEDEIVRLSGDLNVNKRQILDAFQKRVEEMSHKVGFVVESRLSLTDVFQVVDREAYPLLRRSLTKLMTILPTTVSRERCFSVIKRSIHTNMKSDTFIANVMNKLHEGDIRREY